MDPITTSHLVQDRTADLRRTADQIHQERALRSTSTASRVPATSAEAVARPAAVPVATPAAAPVTVPAAPVTMPAAPVAMPARPAEIRRPPGTVDGCVPAEPAA